MYVMYCTKATPFNVTLRRFLHFRFLSVTLAFSFNFPFLSTFSSVSPSWAPEVPGPGSDPPRGCPQDGRRTRQPEVIQLWSSFSGPLAPPLLLTLYWLITQGKQETKPTSQLLLLFYSIPASCSLLKTKRPARSSFSSIV